MASMDDRGMISRSEEDQEEKGASPSEPPPSSATQRAIERQQRGFAAMDEERQRKIASKGGKAAHEKGTAHEFTRDEARAAGKKGGEVVSQNRKHMAEIGRRGGESRGDQPRENQPR